MDADREATAMWEIFDPRDGFVVMTVRWRWLARWFSRRGGYDYARRGEGWIGR
jgi:hypothetical protein